MKQFINEKIKKVEIDFYLTIKKLSQKSIYYPNFSGIGLILYDSDVFDHKWHVDLRPSKPCPKDMRLGEEKTISMLLEISDKSHKLHDGFHFFDYKTGLMKHVAQYFFPPIIPGIDVNENHGTRYHSAMYGSCIKGVILTGIVNSHNYYYVFRKGCLLQENEFDVKA